MPDKTLSIDAGFLEDFQTAGSTYKRLNFFRNFKDMELDGPGIFYLYHEQFGLVRIGQVNGWGEQASLGICWERPKHPRCQISAPTLTEKLTISPTFSKSSTSLKATAP